MKLNPKILNCWIIAAFFIPAIQAKAFSLLGPFQPWMQPTNGLAVPGDIGGPMAITNGYRWNVPVLTYGFDKSFIDFFGTNGEAAVQGAIQILNNLLPASSIVLTSYPDDSQEQNFTAEGQNLFDLKSFALELLVEHMGLAQPARYTYLLDGWNPTLFNYKNGVFSVGVSWGGVEYAPYDEDPGTNLWNFIIGRNYDPQSLVPSPYVNGVLYVGNVNSWLGGVDGNVTGQNSVSTFPFDPNQLYYTAVADFYGLNSGTFYEGLTYDDVGGLRYLLSTNNINYETLLPGVFGVGTNVNSFVNGAWRPGVDKITFIPQPVNPQSGAFLPTTNYYTDNYITNGVLKQQQVARIISQPDILFSAKDVKFPLDVPFYDRTGTTNWLNNAAANGNTNGAGPGVIPPPVQIIFNKLGPEYYALGSISDEQLYLPQPQTWGYWGSFDGSTNPPVSYPIPQSGTNELTVRLWFSFVGNIDKSFDWKLCSLSGAQYAMQTSTNLTDWITLFAVTNNSSVCTLFVQSPASTSRFYRLIPQ